MLDDGVQTLVYFRKVCNKKRNKNENENNNNNHDNDNKK